MEPLLVEGSLPMDSLVTLDSGHVIVFFIFCMFMHYVALFRNKISPAIPRRKPPCFQRTRDFILRLYEAEGAADTVTLNFGIPVKNVAVANMLEEVQEDLGSVQQPALFSEIPYPLFFFGADLRPP